MITQERLFKKLVEKFPDCTVTVEKIYANYGKPIRFQAYIVTTPSIFKHNWSSEYNTIKELVTALNRRFEELDIEPI